MANLTKWYSLLSCLLLFLVLAYSMAISDDGTLLDHDYFLSPGTLTIPGYSFFVVLS